MSGGSDAARVVWITGASSGIGEALARRYAAQGAALILTGRGRPALERVAASLGDASRTLVLPGDLADPAGHEGLADAALAWRGRVDVLVHAAGATQRSPVTDTAMSTTRWMMEVHFLALVALSQAVLPGMLARGGGTIVALGSVVSYVATPQRAAYAAAKHAVRAWAEALRAELSPQGIQVTTVIAGFVATGTSARALRGDGSATGAVEATDAGGVPVDVAADRIFAAVNAGRREVQVGGRELWAVWLQRHFPGIVARWIVGYRAG